MVGFGMKVQSIAPLLVLRSLECSFRWLQLPK